MNGAGLQQSVHADLAYSDYATLKHKYANADNTPENITKAARHFESVFIDMWLKSAREANKVMAEDNFLSGAYMDMSQQMLDHEMSVHLAGNGGIGLAEVIVRQLSGDAPVAAAKTPDAGSLSRTSFRPAADDSHSGRGAATAGPLVPNTAADAVTVSDGVTGRKEPQFSDPRDFVGQLLPVIQQALAGVNISPAAVISQAALETGWGSSVIQQGNGSSSHNLFGIKADRDDTTSVRVNTREYEHGRWLNRAELFKAYNSWSDSVADYVNKITGEERYAGALEAGADPQSYLQALQQAGYATDPNYADKILGIVHRIQEMLGGGE